MQLTKFTKTLNGITPSLAMVPAVTPRFPARARARTFTLPRPSSPEHPFTLFRRQGGRVNYRRRQEAGETVARYLVLGAGASSTHGDGYESRLRGRRISGGAGGSRKWERVGKGSVCAEEGCY